MTDLSREEMNSRLESIETRLENRMRSLEDKIDNKFAQFDMRFSHLEASMHKTAADTIKWVIGTALVMGVSGITVMTFVLNNAVPKAPPAATPGNSTPIIIQMPAQPQASPGAAKIP